MEETKKKKKVGEEERKESWIDTILQDNILALFCSGLGGYPRSSTAARINQNPH